MNSPDEPGRPYGTQCGAESCKPKRRLSERLVEIKLLLAAVPPFAETPAEVEQTTPPPAARMEGALSRIFPLVIAARRARRSGNAPP